MLKIEKGIEKDVNQYVEAARAMENGDSVLMPDAKEAAKLCRSLDKEHSARSHTVRSVDGGTRVCTPRVRKPKVETTA